MNLRQLEMALAVTEFGSYRKAVERLYISQSAIHHEIRLLNCEIGDGLLPRSGRGLELTETGMRDRN
jgi:LysR family nitrogen assimilation transcriptional regulator